MPRSVAGLRLALSLALSALFAVACGGDTSGDGISVAPCGGCGLGQVCDEATNMCVPIGDSSNSPNNDMDGGMEDEDVVDPEDETPEDKTCAVDEDCEEATDYCNLSGMNDEGVCEEGCREGGCAEGEVCNLETRVCEDEPEMGCQGDDDCPEGQTCNVETGECEGTACESDEECGDGEFCDESGFCAPGCGDDADCPEGQTCQDNVCAGLACAEDADCPEDQFCDEALEACDFGCRDDEGCEDGQICLDNSCTEGCREDGDCLAGTYCEEETSACEQGCRSDDECLEDESCLPVEIDEEGTVRQRCVPTPCSQDVDCPDAEFCDIPEDADEGVCAFGCRQGGCPEGQLCDTEDRVCVEEPCEGTEDCPEGSYCEQDFDPPACVPGCDSDEQCDGQPCDLETNTCGCSETADCNDGEVCSLGQCIPACLGQEDCGEGFFCEVETGFCLEGCLDDELEPNDDVNAALPLAEGSYELRMCYEARIGEDFADCFTIALNEDDTLSASLTFSHADGNLDMALYDVNEVALRQAQSTDDNETLSFQAPQAGDFVLCVEPQGGAFESTYGLSFTIDEALGCLDDLNEANNDDVCEDVTDDPINIVINEEFVIGNRTICEEDRDFIAVPMITGQRLDVTLTRTFGDEDLDVRMLGEDCSSILAQTTNIGDVRNLSFQAPADGIFTLEVFGELADFTGSYELSLLLSAGEARCRDDIINDLPVEPNQDADTSTILRPNRDEPLRADNLFVCADDEDWYRVLIDVPSDVIRATISQGVNDVPLEVTIFDTDGVTALDTANEPSPSKSAETLPLAQTGVYFIRVRGTDEVPEAGVNYSLNLLVAGNSECLPDEFEPNNIINTAALISSGTYQATMCRSDLFEADYYKLQLNPGDEVTITIEYDHSLLQFIDALPTILYGPGGEFDFRDFTLRDGDTNTDVLSGGSFLVTPNDGGEWFLGVEAGEAGEGIDYTINVEIVSPDCDEAEDPFEPNESCGEAASLPLFTEQPGFVCGPTDDEDFFGVPVQAGETLRVHMDYFHFDGNLELEIYEPGGDTLADFSYNSGPDFEDVEVVGTVSGVYCVRVFALSSLTQNNYSIEATVD